MIQRPHNNSYHVIPEKFLAGEYPGLGTLEQAESRLRKYLDLGINSYIDLTEEGELSPYDGILESLAPEYHLKVEHTRLSIPDLCVPDKSKMQLILDTIDQHIEENKKVYVHCWGGIGRTGTVVGCHLVSRGFTGEEALQQIAIWWKSVEKSVVYVRSPETIEQAEYIKNWDQSHA